MGNLDWETFVLTQASHVPLVLLGISLQSQCPGTDIPGQAIHRVSEMLLGFRPLSHPSTLQPKPLRPLTGNIPLLLCVQHFIQRSPLCQTSEYEYMTVGIDDTGADEENGYGSSEGHERKPQGKKKFYGGFMNGLKRISLVHRQVLANNVPQVERVDTPPSDMLSPAKPNILFDADTRTSIADTRRDRTLSAVNELYEPSRSHATATPVLVEPRPAEDFAKMESPIRPPPEESIASQVARIRRFMRDLSSLPWISPARISNEYVPGQSDRRRHSRQRYSKTSKSWYSQRNRGTLDLLSGRIPHHVQNSPAPAPRPQFSGGRSRSPSSDGAPSSDSTSNPQYSGPLYPASRSPLRHNGTPRTPVL
ncbi:hypothetical protein DFJ58DRAFT_842305 [Suillus subalutaceus]|uniref:uncharacterized protein n=1 Tax=Suillus subalutaceus TaxID=48586 RepID=UPI001B885111|nr:uncharacterized protein DFJ58DRAFT_842305 [Suillus subalutaceus]KAG1850804.1 hypothetical protein DFJ58DRAFT_842305 [Suillus subalutaceus]